MPRAAIERHARRARPRECCGILVGRAGGGTVTVLQAVPARNVAANPNHGYAIAPAALLAAHRRAHDAGRQIVGYYHSHPGGSARPSRRDLETAWPVVVYLIVGSPGADSVGAGRPAMAAWRLAADRRRFAAVPIRPAREAGGP